MAAIVKVISHVIVEIDGIPYEVGNLTQARTKTLDDDLVYEQIFDIEPETYVEIFNVNQLTSFNFLLIESDLDLLVQVVGGLFLANDFFVLKLVGSGTSRSYGIPIVLTSDYVQKGTEDLFDGVEGQILNITAYNEDDTDTARVHIFAVQ